MNKKDIYLARESNKIRLSTYLDDTSFSFPDLPVKELIENLEKKIMTEYDQAYKSTMIDKKYGGLYDLNKAFYLEQQLIAIQEMTIVNLYKNLEINIKKLLEAAYNAKSNDFDKWEVLKNYLKTKNINFSNISGYNEVNQLRQVNNVIKHTHKLRENEWSHIEEFSNKDKLNTKDLQNFYNRIKSAPTYWFLGLRDAIYDELYKFDDTRLEWIAQDYALRMDASTMKRFIQIFKNKY